MGGMEGLGNGGRVLGWWVWRGFGSPHWCCPGMSLTPSPSPMERPLTKPNHGESFLNLTTNPTTHQIIFTHQPNQTYPLVILPTICNLRPLPHSWKGEVVCFQLQFIKTFPIFRILTMSDDGSPRGGSGKGSDDPVVIKVSATTKLNLEK